MKKALLFFTFSFVSLFSFTQKGQIGAFIPIDSPIKSIMPNMNTNIGFGIQGSYSPFYGAPFYIELKGSWGTYSQKSLEQTYFFSDSSQTATNVNYKSSLRKYLLGTKFMIGNDFRAVRGFITPQVGLAKYRTNIVITDPSDVDDCKPLDRKTTQKDIGFVYGGELGVEISLDRIFKTFEDENKHKLLISGSFLNGFNHFEYANVRYMKDEVHGTNVTHADADINTTFINLSTNELHEHKIGELYHTSLMNWGINIGYVYNF